MKKIIVTGATGMAGVVATKFFTKAGYSVVPLSRKDYHLAKDPFEKFAALAQGADAIVNCAGVIKPMMATTPIEEVLRVNTVFPRNLGKFSQASGIPAFHLTTDCVYTGKTGRYDEKSYFDADDSYGMTKNGGDTSDCMTLRTSIIGEERGQARSLIEWAKSQAGKTVKGFTNHSWNGITTLQFAESVDTILKKNLYQPGLFHVHSPDTVTKLELLKILDRVYSLNLTIDAAEASAFCDRSLASVHALTGQLGIPTIEKQVTKLRDFFRENF